MLILHLPELRFASQLPLEPPVIPVIPTTKQNNTDKKLDFSTDGVFVQYDKSENTKLSIVIKHILNRPAQSIQKLSYLRLFGPVNLKLV